MRRALGFAGLALALCLGIGEGQAQGDALERYRLGAAQGDAAALNSLGAMFESGSGVPADPARAYALFGLAASMSNADPAQVARANQSRASLALKMSAAQLAQAQELLARCYGDDIRHCGEKILSGAVAVASLSTPGAREGGKLIVPLENFRGIYMVRGVVNDVMALNFMVDTGATDVAIPADIVESLMKTGTITKADFLGEGIAVLADGSRMPSQIFQIRSLKIGDVVINNVRASVTPRKKGGAAVGSEFFRQIEVLVLGQHAPRSCYRVMPAINERAPRIGRVSLRPSRSRRKTASLTNFVGVAQPLGRPYRAASPVCG